MRKPLRKSVIIGALWNGPQLQLWPEPPKEAGLPKTPPSQSFDLRYPREIGYLPFQEKGGAWRKEIFYLLPVSRHCPLSERLRQARDGTNPMIQCLLVFPKRLLLRKKWLCVINPQQFYSPPWLNAFGRQGGVLIQGFHLIKTKAF